MVRRPPPHRPDSIGSSEHTMISFTSHPPLTPASILRLPIVALSGIHHSHMNAWPLVLLAGSSESFQSNVGMGAFQEMDQVSVVKGVGGIKCVCPCSSSNGLVWFVKWSECRQEANLVSCFVVLLKISPDSLQGLLASLRSRSLSKKH
jgi:hypothetical protein